MEKLDMMEDVTADLHHLKAVLTTLSHTFGGDYPADERPDEHQLCLAIQWASKVADRTCHLASDQPSSNSSALACELMELSALLHLMDATNLALDLRIAFNDELMSGYFDAMAHCAARALATIDLDQASPSLKERLAVEEMSRKRAAEATLAREHGRPQ
ncbi:hypothetical protein WAE61_17325 [Comamonadaceae bacterium PP-2]